MKTVLITGATSGIGLATVQLLAKQKFKLIICGRKIEVLTKLQNQLSELTEVFSLNFDVRDQKAVQHAIANLPEHFKNIDILINNAGNAHGLDTIADGNIADWDAMIDGNVKGLLYVSQPVIKKMKAQKSGHIINISSVAARQTYAQGVVYCASKNAVDVISEGMRLELTEFGIKVSNIQPGAVETAFSEVRFKGNIEKAVKVYEGYEALQPEDVADLISYIINAPERVSIADVAIFPKAQAEPRTIYRNV